jgi:hypothetical protein
MELRELIKLFDSSNKLHKLLASSEEISARNSLEVYTDIGGSVRQEVIPIRPYYLTIPDSAVPFNFHGSEIRATAVV